MTVIGVDVSVSKTGLALADGKTLTVKTSAGPADPWRRLHELEAGLVRALRAHPPLPRIAVLEDYALGSPGKRSLIASAEAGGVIRAALFGLGVDLFVLVPPSQLKRYGTGSGGSEKAAMIRAARAEGAVLSSDRADDEADAYLLRHAGRALLGLDPAPSDPERLACLEKIAEKNESVLRDARTAGIAPGRSGAATR